eukprot:15069035-Alexandrium_andersonii.AAC.1
MPAVEPLLAPTSSGLLLRPMLSTEPSRSLPPSPVDPKALPPPPVSTPRYLLGCLAVQLVGH